MFQKFRVKQLRQLGFFDATWHWHLGTLTLTLVRPQLEYAAPNWHPYQGYHETQIAQMEKVQRTATRWTCRRWRNASSVGDMLDELELPSLEARREQSFITFFYKINSGTVSLDTYLTPAPNIRRTPREVLSYFLDT